MPQLLSANKADPGTMAIATLMAQLAMPYLVFMTLASLLSAGAEVRFGSDAPVAPFPALDARQFAMLVEDSRIDEMQALFMRRHPGPFMPAWHGYEMLTRSLQVAEKARLNEPALLDWCEFLWREGQIETPSTAADKFANWRAPQVDQA